MAERFNLTAVLQLQAPTNTAQVMGQVQKQLGKLGVVNLKINADTRSLAAVQGQLQKVDKSARSAGKGMGLFGRNISEAARRFSVITIATGSFIALARSIKNAVGAAITFEREMVKISQVTGHTLSNLSGLSGEVTRLSTTLGVANQSLLETSRILAQAGFSALKTRQALEVLANTTLAPSFDNIIDTTEGAIAIVNQFGRQAKKTGGEIQFLEDSLDAINQVSKTFAVESKDLITAVRRTGGVFEAAGGKINELIALFTSVRQTTRESAETIATGFRTIFTRLQRSETLDALEQLGISLSDVEGKFIGPLKAVEALAAGLAGLDPKDVRFAEIVEQLGGFRQVGKVIPLIKQYAVATEALAVANMSAGSTSKDAQTAQQALAVQFSKVVQQFDALIRKFSESDAFRGMAKTIIKLAETFLKFAESLEKVLPLLAGVAAIKIGRSLAPALGGLFGGGRGKQFGGVVRGFSGGGFVPGAGDRDTVPAMLQPGEFVIKKRSANKLGANKLQSMNRYADGGKTAAGAKKKEEEEKKKVGKLVARKGVLQGSHIGADVAIDADNMDRVFKSKGIKFQRSFLANTQGKDINTYYNYTKGQTKAERKMATDKGDKAVKAAYAGISNDEKSLKALKAMGLTAKVPIALNLPKSYNQALRVSDINLVKRSMLADEMTSGPDLFSSKMMPQSLQTALIGSKSGNKLRRSLKSRISRLPTQTGPEQSDRARHKPAAFDSDPELNPIKRHLATSLFKLDPKATAAIFDKLDIMFKGSGILTGADLESRKSGDRDAAVKRSAMTKKALGGLVQRFAMGGIAKVNKIGAAILDPDMGMSKEGIPVGIKDVQAAIKGSTAEPSLVKKNLGKAFKGKTYNLSRQGLNKKTSDGFKQKIVEGLGVGLDHATSTLGADLGLGSSKMNPGSVKEFQNYISKRPVVGDLFEAAVQSLGTSGKFTEAAVSAPFDFPGGLSGKLKDNYSNLPKSFIDAKSSYGAASAAGMKSKVVNELVAELHRSGEYARLAKPSKEVAAGKATAAAAVKKVAKGGSISGTDSVPSLLTPGEFVVKKSAARSIGYSKLNRMNKTGIAGFAEGGIVGFERFAEGGKAKGGSGSVATPNAGAVKKVDAANKAYAKAMTGAAKKVGGMSKGLASVGKKGAKLAKKLSAAAKKAAVASKGLTSVGKKGGELAKKLSAVSKKAGVASKGLGSVGKKSGELVKKLSTVSKKAGEAGKGLSRVGKKGTALAKVFVKVSKKAEEAGKGLGSVGKKGKALADAMDKVEDEADDAGKGLKSVGKKGKGLAAKLKKVEDKAKEAGKGLKGVGKGGKALESDLQKTVDADKKLREASNKLAQKRAQVAKQTQAGPAGRAAGGAAGGAPGRAPGGAPGGAGGGMGAKAAKGLGAVAGGAQKLGGAMSKLSGGLVALTFIAGTLVESIGGMSKAEKEQTQAGLAQVGAWGAILSELTALSFSLIAATAAGFQLMVMKRLETTMTGKTVGGKLAEAGASALTTGADIGEAGGSALTTGADIAEAGGSAIAGTADAAEAAGSAAAAASDAAEAALSLLVAKAKVIEMGASLFAAKADLVEAGGSGVATTADLAEATGTASVTAALVSMLAILTSIISALVAAAGASGVTTGADLAEGAGSQLALTSDVAEGAGSQLALTSDVGEAAGSQLALTSDMGEAAGSLQTTIADMAEASASALTTIADTAEAAGSGLALTTDVAEAGGSALTTGADVAETVGSISATTGDIAESAASWMVTLALGALALAVIAVVVAFGGGFLMSVYKTGVALKKLEQATDASTKAADEQLNKLKETGGGSKEKFVGANVDAAANDFSAQIIEATAMTRHLSTAMSAGSMALGGAAIGAAIGSIIPGVGTAIGAALGAGIGAVTGMVIGLKNAWTGYDKVLADTIKKQAANMALVVSASTRLAGTTWDNVKALGNFERSLKEAAAAQLDAVQTLGLMNTGSANLSAQVESSAAEMNKAGQEVTRLRQNLAGEGLMTSGGEIIEESSEQATGEDPRTAQQEKDIARFKQLSKQHDAARKSHNDLIKKFAAQEGALRAQLAKSVGHMVTKVKDLDFGGIELADIKSLDDLLKTSEAFGKEWSKALVNINKSIDEQFKEAEKEADRFIGQGGSRAFKGKQLKKEIGVQKAARKDQAAASVQKAAVDRILAEQKAQQSILATAHIEALKAKALADVNTSLRGLNNALLGATNTARNFAKIDTAISLANLEGPAAATFDTAAFDVDDLRQIDEDILNKALEQGVTAMTAGMGINAPAGDKLDKQIVDRANSMRDSVVIVKDVMDNVANAWGDQVGKALPKQEGARRELAANMFDQLNASVGGALQAGGVDTDVGKLVKDMIAEQINAGDPIDFDFINEVIEGLDPSAALEAMKAFVEAQNQFISKMDEVNTAILAQKNKYAEALANVVDVTEKAADRMANIRGKPRGRFEKETGRRTAAQAKLGTTATGAGAIAGDVNATANALKTLKDQADASATAAKTASTKNKVLLNKTAKDQANAAKRATDELGRLADQSARAADIEAEIAKEREKRGQVTSVLEEFAFAGREQQADMTGQMRDVLTAASQGSMAGATDEQRAGIGSMLDKLADVEIGDTGKTGRELKAELTEKQLVSQGVDPRLARQVGEEAAKGSKEEQLLGELEALGQQEIDAANALAEHAVSQIDYLDRIAVATEGAFQQDINAGQRKAEKDEDREKKDENIKAIEDQYKALGVAIESMVSKQEAFTTAIDNAAQRVADAIAAIDTMKKDIEATPIGEKHTGPGAVERPDIEAMRDTSWASNVDVQVEPVEITLIANMPDWLTADVLGTTPTLAKVGIESHSGAGNRSAEGVSGFAKGGSVFQPRGTDTVPAMLTPGEFVVRKSAVDKIGAENLAALNQGKGGAVYHQQGGMVGLPTAGNINSAFYKLIKGGNRSDVVSALTAGGFKDGLRIYKDLRELADAGKLDVRKLQGPQQLENMFQILRKSKWLRGVNPTLMGLPDISSNLSGLSGQFEEGSHALDSPKIWAAIGQISSYSNDLKQTEEALGKMTGGTGTFKAMRFAGEMIRKAGLTKGNFADRLVHIGSDFTERASGTAIQTEKFKTMFAQSGAMEEGSDSTTGKAGQIPTSNAMSTWTDLVTDLKKFSGASVAQNKAVAEFDEEKKRGAVTAELGDRLGRIYLRLKDAGVLRMAKGGSVADTIPAMLTPGEFVMSPEAVQKHGVGFMRDLNRGHAPGFRRGGLIGRGNVAYRRRGSNNAEGGGTTLMVDPSSLQAVLSEFNAQFVGYLDIMISEFALNTGALTGLTNAIQGGMVMTHNFSGALEFNVKIGNKKNIEEAVAKGLEGTLQTMIETEVDKKITKMKDEP